MLTEKRLSQVDHDRMVQRVAELLRQNGFSDIRADLMGYRVPERIFWEKTGHGHIPDVTANGVNFCVLEVETYDSIDDRHASDQWKLFAAFASQHNAVFYVVIPAGSKSKAVQRLSALGILAEIIEV